MRIIHLKGKSDNNLSWTKNFSATEFYHEGHEGHKEKSLKTNTIVSFMVGKTFSTSRQNFRFANEVALVIKCASAGLTLSASF